MADPVLRDPSVPCSTSKKVEQRNTDGLRRNGTRNTGGTLDLKVLARQALSRLQGGTPGGTGAEQKPEKLFHPPGTPCPHATDPELAEWYAENPKLTCARCWLERHGMPIQAGLAARPEGAADGARNGGGVV
jgi:hypothetical protein